MVTNKTTQGFEPPVRFAKPGNENEGPAIVFADSTQTIFLADMTGDGLTDIVRIRHRSVCYWPNMGYGRFGKQIIMNNPPQLDTPDLFHPRRIRLADVDGSGTTDIIYMNGTKTRYWKNLSGNRWSEPVELNCFPASTDMDNLSVVDLMGNGTSCLVWSSPMPSGQRQVRYVELTNGVKPHLLTQVDNNMGAITRLQYAPSTKFYLRDKSEGKPWITRLPFPVQVLERVETLDQITQSRFVTLYGYHHGYFDGVEREFRGFGMVEQWDSEQYANANNTLFDVVGANIDESSFVPPVYTKTWFHTGFYRNRNEISNHYKTEYFNGDNAAWLLPDTLLPEGLSAAEAREACRALKGSVLRQEIYALDGTAQQATPYTVEEKSYRVERLQPLAGKAHALFLVTADQALAYHYERNAADPRILHTLTLETDTWGNVLKSAQVAYPRRSSSVISEQSEMLIQFTQNSFINVDDVENQRHFIGIPCEAKTFEIKGWTGNSKMEREVLLSALDNPASAGIEKVLVAHSLTFFAKPQPNYATGLVADARLPHGAIARHGLPYRTYNLAFSNTLIQNLLDLNIKTTEPFEYHNNELKEFTASELSILLLHSEKGKYQQPNGDTAQYWQQSEMQEFDTQNFGLPKKWVDPMDNKTTLEYDVHCLLINKTVDSEGFETVITNNYRLLQPVKIKDVNENFTSIRFNTLGLVSAVAVQGKETAQGVFQGDTLDDPTQVFIYNFNEWLQNQKPNYVVHYQRENHGTANATPWPTVNTTNHGQNSGWLESITYVDGLGNGIATKAQAEDGKALQISGNTLALSSADVSPRWAVNGRVILNNKGKTWKQFEPYFTDSHTFDNFNLADNAADFVKNTTHVYDPVGRPVRTDMPDGTFTKVKFDPWKQENWDANDTVLESQWYADRNSANPQSTEPTNKDERAAYLAAKHANTPQTVYFDVLGRAVQTHDHNLDANGNNVFVVTQLKLDIKGNILQMTDALGIAATQNHYNLLGQPIYTHNVDSGRRFMLSNNAGQPYFVWDNLHNQTKHSYDVQNRPLEILLTVNGTNKVVEKNVYGTDTTKNNRGKIAKQYDQSGKTVFSLYDFNGNVLQTSKTFAQEYANTIDWTNPLTVPLQSETFSHSFTYDALNRPLTKILPDNTVQEYTYNKAGLLETVKNNNQLYVENINYNEKGQRIALYFGNGSKTKYEYDANTFRLTRILTTRNTGADILQDLNYTYDPVGNITEQTDNAQQTFYFSNAVIEPKGQYTYDALYRLTEATGRELTSLQLPTHEDFANNIAVPNPASNAMQNYTQQYSYDKLGNILQTKSVGKWTRNYFYNSNNNYLVGHSENTTEYTYDAHGNMLTMPHLSTMDWDHENMIVKTTKGTESTFYRYDASGERVRKITAKQDGSKEERLYLGGYEVYRKIVGENIEKERTTISVNDDKKRIATVDTLTIDGGIVISNQTAIVRYQYDNHLGSASLELDENAAIISYEEYHPFGTTSYRSGRTETEVSLKRYKYVGKERDDETGLYYYGARYYASWIARFISTDPMKAERTWLTPYNYVQNKPINRTDPTGALDEEPPQKREPIIIDKMQGILAPSLSTRNGTNLEKMAAKTADGTFSVPNIEAKLGKSDYDFILSNISFTSNKAKEFIAPLLNPENDMFDAKFKEKVHRLAKSDKEYVFDQFAHGTRYKTPGDPSSGKYSGLVSVDKTNESRIFISYTTADSPIVTPEIGRSQYGTLYEETFHAWDYETGGLDLNNPTCIDEAEAWKFSASAPETKYVINSNNGISVKGDITVMGRIKDASIYKIADWFYFGMPNKIDNQNREHWGIYKLKSNQQYGLYEHLKIGIK